MATQLMLDWIDALESGKYSQTQGQLAYQNGKGDRSYCCLGVLCEIAGVSSSVDEDGSIRFEGLLSLPPYHVIRLLFDREPGRVSEDNVVLFENEEGDPINADRANDGLGMTFPEIAQKLREKYVDVP